MAYSTEKGQNLSAFYDIPKQFFFLLHIFTVFFTLCVHIQFRPGPVIIWSIVCPFIMLP